MQFDDDAITRIVAAVGDRYAPAAFDRHALAEASQDACEKYEMARHCDALPTDRQCRKRIEALAKHAARLRDAIPPDDGRAWSTSFRLILEAEAFNADPETVARLAGAGCPEGVRAQAAVGRAIEAVQFLAGLLDQARKRAEFTALRFEDAKTAERMLFGAWLPEVYEAHFGRRAGASRSRDQAIGGPYIRFAMAVAQEMGATYLPETVKAALARHGKRSTKK